MARGKRQRQLGAFVSAFHLPSSSGFRAYRSGHYHDP